FSQSYIGKDGEDPTTTASDIALFFEKLYKGQMINSTYANTMLDLLKQQKLNEKIPKYLPDSVPVAHKTGELEGVTHDAGIIYAPNSPYILVALSDSDSPDFANERIAAVSQAVYNFFIPQNQN
ncbi:MAG: serine hydrolase, partial [Candidatus Levyibacteriota bacterium]